MKLSEIIAGVKPESVEKYYGDLYMFSIDLGIDNIGYDNDSSNRITYAYPMKWLCTDTHVGLCVHYFDGEVFAISMQSARKSDEQVYYINEEMKNKFKEYLLSISGNQENVTYADLNQEFGEHFEVRYYDQLLNNEGFYNGEPVTAIGNGDPCNYVSKKVKILHKSGEQEIIDVEDFKIPYNQ